MTEIPDALTHSEIELLHAALQSFLTPADADRLAAKIGPGWCRGRWKRDRRDEALRAAALVLCPGMSRRASADLLGREVRLYINTQWRIHAGTLPANATPKQVILHAFVVRNAGTDLSNDQMENILGGSRTR